MKKVTIYSTPNCIHCNHAKEFFQKNNVEYTEKNVAEDEAARQEMVGKTGQLGVPVIEVEGETEPIIGFNEEALVKALGV